MWYNVSFFVLQELQIQPSFSQVLFGENHQYSNTNKIEVLGNIKLSTLTTQDVKAMNLSRPYVLAASTRDDEEQLIVGAWLKAKADNHLLVIVPRHIQRLPEILKQLKSFNLNIAKFY